MTTILKIAESKQPATQAEIAIAVNESVQTNNVSVGTRVAVVGDPTFPFEGICGKVKSMAGGFSSVEFENGVTADLVTNLLVPVS